jgi:methionyl-tRNA synthetase
MRSGLKKNSKKILITSALPYANGQLHFGHIVGAYLPADCYARFERLNGKNVLYICGSDEYGVAITLSAEIAKRTPQEHVDYFHNINKELFKKLFFSFDHFSRTTSIGHRGVVQQFFLDLLSNGYIEEKITQQLYSEQEKRFLADRYVMGICPQCGFDQARGDECQRCGASYEATDLKKPLSKLTKSPLVLKETTHWFLLLDLFKDKLFSWINQKKWKPGVLHFAQSYIENARPRAITRDSNWGVPIPLPQAEGKVFYVWFDAVVGYISATKEWAELRGDPEAWKNYWADEETTYVQFVGKDNIPFHAVFFPAMIMGQNYPYKKVDTLSANEFLTFGDKQFSKTDGVTIDLAAFFQHFSADQIRYALAANAPETQDTEFTWENFQIRCNAELVGKYGNLVNRALTFVHNQFQSKIPAKGVLQEKDKVFLEKVRCGALSIKASYETLSLRKTAALIMDLAQDGNVYFDEKKPWSLVKNATTILDASTTLFCSLECLKVLSLVSSPIIPESAQKLWEMLGFSSDLSKENWDNVICQEIHEGRQLPPQYILFKKIEGIPHCFL